MEAYEAYETGLKHEPENAQLKTAMQELDKKMSMIFSFSLIVKYSVRNKI